MGDMDISGGFLYSSVDGENFAPLGVAHDFNIETIDMDISPEYSEAKIFGPTEMTFTIKLKTKHRRKTFKKWLMSKNYSRDEAEAICDMLALAQGKVSYEQWFWIFSLSHNELRNLIYNWGGKSCET